MGLPFKQADIFRGYFEDDIDRINGLRGDPWASEPDVYIDPIGVKTSVQSCFWIGPYLGRVDKEFQLVENPLGAEPSEYVSLALALEWAKGRDCFVAGEIGAGWGPWISAAGVAGRRRFPQVTLVAFEAHPDRFAMLREHLAQNCLIGRDAADVGEDGGVSWRLFQAAISESDGTLYWPKDMPAHDAGGAVLADACQSYDYRGLEVEKAIAVPAISFASAFRGIDHVDYLHIDIQGGEGDLIPASRDFLDQCVKSMFIGTHSRKIEGDLIGILRDWGWVLMREKPCQFYSMASSPTLTGLTYIDGCQFWVNQNI